MAENLVGMCQALRSGRYQMQPYLHFSIFEPKKREIYAASYTDRVMLHCVCDEVLVPFLERRLIYDNAACRKNKGTLFALERLSGFLRQHYARYGNAGYALKADISQYFANIDHEILKTKLAKDIKDRDVRQLLFRVIDSYETEGLAGKGLPLGNQTSQCFAIYYLDQVDRFIKEKLRVKHYIRYMDDFILIHPDRDFLYDCLQQIRMLLENELQLHLNPKTQIIPLRRGVTFLGWRFILTDGGKVVRKLKRDSRVRMKRKMRCVCQKWTNGDLEAKDVAAFYASCMGHLKQGNTFYIQKELAERVTSARLSAENSHREVM